MAHFGETSNHVSISNFKAIFKLTSNTNRIHEGLAIWIVSHYVLETLANDRKSRICAEDKSNLITVSVPSNDARSQKNLRTFPELFNYLHKTFSTG